VPTGGVGGGDRLAGGAQRNHEVMVLSDLTSREAVLRAIEECDKLRRGAFLAKYGFGPARDYVLVHEGKEYDSKAIAGVAHGYQHPHLGPLRSSEFHGGKDTVKPLLERLGFKVARIKPRASEGRRGS